MKIRKAGKYKKKKSRAYPVMTVLQADAHIPQDRSHF